MIHHSASAEATAQTCCGRNRVSIPDRQADEQEATTGITTPSKALQRTAAPFGSRALGMNLVATCPSGGNR